MKNTFYAMLGQGPTYTVAVVMLILTSLLTACHHGRIGLLSQPHTCQSVCLEKAQACRAVCRNNCLQCTASSIQSAKRSYIRWAYEKFLTCEPRTRSLNSYRDPLQCRKITCDCPLDYQVCIQTCGGIIRKQLTAPRAC